MTKEENKNVSIIIVRHGNLGFSASLRFKNESKNCDLSSGTKEGIYREIERKLA